MTANYRVVLDACVLIPMPLTDTLLRMAEASRLYLPKWSKTIMDEVTRNLIAKWDMAPEKARRRAAVRSHSELIVTYNRRHFPAASLQPWEIDVQGPSTFLLAKNVPGFVAYFCEEQGIDLAGERRGVSS